MDQGRKRGAGFTITELMVVLVIIGILAAVATPSFTRDSTARKGREFARMVAQTMQRAHLEAMSSRVPHFVNVFNGRLDVYRADIMARPVRSLMSPTFSGSTTDLAIWAADTAGSGIPSRPGTISFDTLVGTIFFNPMGNASDTPGSAAPVNWEIFIRNQALNPKHPDGGFVVTITGLTSFVSMRNIEFTE
jgi:prepilin-type N-terminal cleavage/methylation domain-containing protein